MWFASKGRISRNQDESSRPQPVKIDASLKTIRKHRNSMKFATFLPSQHVVKSLWILCFFEERWSPFHDTSSEQILWMVSSFYLQISEAVKHSDDFSPGRPHTKGGTEWFPTQSNDQGAISQIDRKGEGDQDLSLDLYGIRYTVTHTNMPVAKKNGPLQTWCKNVVLPEHFGFRFQPCMFVSKGEVVISVGFRKIKE